ncbi:MAG: hypothetical protein EP338_02370 [Bacteroidetes bacterium]|nr:MAG: hypothetical protein EP338_02370 [Bacteroidota bacterium]
MQRMSMNRLLWGVFLLIGISVRAQSHFEVLEQSENEYLIRFHQSVSGFQYTEIEGGQYINFAQSHRWVSLDEGEPQLPVFGESFRIANRGKVTVTIEKELYQDFTGVQVAPSKGNLSRNVNPESIPYHFSETYQQDAAYPASVISELTPFVMRSVRGQVVHLTPYRYNPVQKHLRVYTDLLIRITVDPLLSGVNEPRAEQVSRADQEIFKSLFAKQTAPVDKYKPIDEEGDVLIVCRDSYSDALGELVQWKQKKGLKVELMKFGDMDQLSPEQLHDSIRSRYELNPSIRYLMLVGDHEQIPGYTYGQTSSWEELYSDTYYGQLEGSDFYPELFVGRLSGTTEEVALMSTRILEYEREPKGGDSYQKAIGVASSEGAGYGDDGQADWQHMRGLRNELLDAGYTKVYEFYDGSRGGDDAPGNPNSMSIEEAVNDGVGLYNYTGHGDLNTCFSGGFSSNNVSKLVNTGKYPMVVSVACNNGGFVGQTCIGENWLRASDDLTGDPTGAIAACGSSILMSWAPPMETQDEMTRLILEKADYNPYSMGALFYNAQLSMLEKYPGKGVEVMQTWIFFGDPEIAYRNEVPKALEVQHQQCLPEFGQPQYFVSANEEGASVVIWQDGQVIRQGKIENGQCVFELSAVSGDLEVIVTKDKSIPYFGQIKVGQSDCEESEDSESLMMYQFGDEWYVYYLPKSDFVELSVHDVRGRLVISKEFAAQNHQPVLVSLGALGHGMYVLRLKDGSQGRVEKFMRP